MSVYAALLQDCFLCNILHTAEYGSGRVRAGREGTVRFTAGVWVPNFSMHQEISSNVLVPNFSMHKEISSNVQPASNKVNAWCKNILNAKHSISHVIVGGRIVNFYRSYALALTPLGRVEEEAHH
jgi:hypothetical protein